MKYFLFFVMVLVSLLFVAFFSLYDFSDTYKWDDYGVTVSHIGKGKYVFTRTDSLKTGCVGAESSVTFLLSDSSRVTVKHTDGNSDSEVCRMGESLGTFLFIERSHKSKIERLSSLKVIAWTVRGEIGSETHRMSARDAENFKIVMAAPFSK